MANLVPAAAVIPAPRAYTDIAAVKALVVCHRVAGLLKAILDLLVRNSLDPTFDSMALRPQLKILFGEIAPAQSLLQ